MALYIVQTEEKDILSIKKTLKNALTDGVQQNYNYDYIQQKLSETEDYQGFKYKSYIITRWGAKKKGNGVGLKFQ